MARFEPCNDPVKAEAIAMHTQRTLADIRACRDPARVVEIAKQWQAYADSQGVAEQIRDHVRTAVNETLQTLKAIARDAQISVAKRIAGERDD